ncbi:MAG: B12-binding domain-containing radical SAM protein [Lachnospiraceae bacterium]|nr:B12-binding domain-containing radical SAM protein [Lachnospiraceae bacterium]
MNKILLINSPLGDTREYRKLLPLGISYLASALKDAGLVCDTVDGDLDCLPLNEIVRLTSNYDLIGISSTTSNFPYAAKMAQAIKTERDIPIILGGYHATFEHEEILKGMDCFDAIVRGEGETVIVELCKDYFKNNSFSQPINGVSYRQLNGKILISSNINLENNLDKLSLPVRDNLLKYQKDYYLNQDKKIYVTVLSSRGCPYGCSFCATTCFRRVWLARSPESVADEVYLLYKEYKDILVAFIDDNFFIDPIRSKEIILRINEKCEKKIFFKFGTRADQIIKGAEYLDFFKENGCRSIELGIENGSDSVLERYYKNTTALVNELAIKTVRSHGIQVAIDYIMFDPKTTVNELRENILFIKNTDIWGEYLPLIYNRVEPFPGTKFKTIYGEAHSNDNYFTSANVKQIYDLITKFKDTYQIRINKLIDDFIISINDGSGIRISKREYIWLRTMPYILFDELVAESSDYLHRYNLVVSENKLEEHLSFLEKKLQIN